MRHVKKIRKEHIGRPVDFAAYDGRTYNGKVVEVLRRGIHIRYYVPQVMRECDAHVPNAVANERITLY